jgi:hypothetical protein
MHIRKLITIAEKPKIITRSLKKGSGKTAPGVAATGFLASSLLIKMNIKKQMLQINVNREKNEINFIKNNCLKILSPK